jgi:Acetyltransferase (GNAT) domain
VIEVSPGAWDATLTELGVADAYLLRSYVEASCVLDPGRPVLLREGDVVFAAIEREIEGSDRRDVTTPYGYGGPAGRGDAAAFSQAYEKWCRERGVVTTFIRFHPLLENVGLAPEGTALERLADTATWPLEGDLEKGMHSMHRRGAKKAAKADVQVQVTVGPDDLSAFVELYEAAMKRHDAEDFYLFPAPYWAALLGLGDKLVRMDATLDGELVASQLLLATRPWLHYHLGAASDAGFDLGASKLLFLEAARWGQELLFVELHLGSGLGGSEDSLWEFKQRLSPAPGRPFWIGKLVHDEAAYRELGGSGTDGFFPAYRAPAAVEA